MVRRWLILLGLTVVCAALFFWLATKHRFFDLGIYINAVRWWADGHDLYAYAQKDIVQGRLYFTYPPFAAILLFPFGFLSLPVTQTIFTIGTVLAVIVTTRWLFRAAGLAHWWIFAVPLILLIEPMRENIMLGQINMLLVVLIMWDLLILGPKSSRWTGVGIGLATALKLIPGIFIVYFLVTRQWRAAIVSSAAAAAATLLSAAIAPRASWDFWTHALWDTNRVGRTDYTGNQSILGLLHRLVVPEQPNRVLWIILVAAIAAFGLWRAAKAHTAGDTVAAMALVGLLGGLVSPITWPHHLYWLVPGLVAMLAAKRWALFAGGYLLSVYGVFSLRDWGPQAVPTGTVLTFLGRNAFVLLALAFLIVIPIRHYPTRIPE